jgi:heavy metal sensor kinase
MRLPGSIRLRLLLWQGALLALALTAFGVTAWRLERTTRLQRVDQELERRVAAVLELTRPRPGERSRPAAAPVPDRPGPDGAGPPRDGRPRRPRPAGQGAPPPFAEAGGGPFYYVAWDRVGREVARSAAAPPGLTAPDPGDEPRSWRLRGDLREHVHIDPGRGDRVVVGREIAEELVALRRFGWRLGAAGTTVFALGLAGGWWIASRALRPIATISATARRISTGNLAERVPVAKGGSELDELGQVLNDAFARLQASFARQARFTADASHELRTPVTVVLTQTQSSLTRERSAAEYREALEACQRAAQRMRRLIDSLLALARVDSGEQFEVAACDLAHVAGEAVALLRPLAELRGVPVEAELGAAPCTGDADQLGRVVANLLGNAIDHSQAGARVRVTTGSEPGAVILSVADEGPGIAAQDLPHVFERFYRADKARSQGAGHAGLGLAIVQAIVTAHGGRIDVASAPGSGARFTVRLPA